MQLDVSTETLDNVATLMKGAVQSIAELAHHVSPGEVSETADLAARATNQMDKITDRLSQLNNKTQGRCTGILNTLARTKNGPNKLKFANLALAAVAAISLHVSDMKPEERRKAFGDVRLEQLKENRTSTDERLQAFGRLRSGIEQDGFCSKVAAEKDRLKAEIAGKFPDAQQIYGEGLDQAKFGQICDRAIKIALSNLLHEGNPIADLAANDAPFANKLFTALPELNGEFEPKKMFALEEEQMKRLNAKDIPRAKKNYDVFERVLMSIYESPTYRNLQESPELFNEKDNVLAAMEIFMGDTNDKKLSSWSEEVLGRMTPEQMDQILNKYEVGAFRRAFMSKEA